MKKLSKKQRLYFQLCLGAALVILIPLLITTFQQTKSAQAAWFDDSWSYRKAVNIATHTAAENNVYINLTGANDIDTSDTGRFQTDCGDLRFTDAGGKLLQYYIVSGCSTADTVVHVFFSTMPAGAQTVYYYYGNPTVQNGGNAADFATEASNYTFTTIGDEEKTPGPIAYWKLDDATGTNAQDSTTNNKDGTLSGSTLPSWQTEDQCISGKCLYFDGSNSYIDTTYSKSSGDGTVAVWFRAQTQTSDTGSIFRPIVIQGNFDGVGNTNPEGILISMIRSGSSDVGKISGSWGNDSVSFTTTETYDDNRWHYAVITKSGTTGTLYIDGISKGTWVATDAVNTGTNFQIGGSTTASARKFKGFIDEAKVYPYARSAAQVKTDYNSRGSVKGSSAVIASDQRSNLSNGLVGYWKMDESTWASDCSTTSVTDSSGNGNNGKPCANASAPSPTTGKFGNGGSFNGSSNYIDVADPSSGVLDFGTGSFTASAWVKPSATTGGRIINKWDQTNTLGWVFDVNTTTSGANQAGYVRFRMQDGAAGTNIDYSADGSLSTGSWKFVTVTINRSQNELKLFVNGAQVGTTQSLSTITGSISNTASVGMAAIPSSLGNYFPGVLDEARIYNRTLSPAEVSQLYNFAPGPVSYWDFNENAGTQVKDQTNNISAATLTGTTWTQGKYGSALSFNGTSDGINLGDTSTLEFKSTDAFTISAWVKANTMSANSQIIGKMGGSTAFQGWVFWLNSSGQPSVILRNDNATNNYIALNGTNDVDNNAWRHVSFSYDGSKTAAGVKIYVDGVLQSTTVTTDGLTGEMQNTSANASIGYRDATSGVYFPGSIDDIQIYKYLRTNKQIVETMNAGHPAVGSPVGSAVGHWKFDEGADNTCSGGTNDACNSGSGGSAIDGAQSGMATPATAASGWTNSGKFNKALQFDGTNDFVTVSSNAALDAADSYTLSAWIRLDQLASTKGSSHVISSKVENSGGNSRTFYTFVGTTTDLLTWIQGTGSGTTALVGTTTIAANTWYHVAFVVDNATDQMRAYVNGKLEGTPTPFTGNPSTNTASLQIGAISGVTGFTDTFMDGTIDEFKIYNYALTADEVKLDMNRGSSQVLGSLSDKSTYEKQAANQEYCVPGDTSTSCAAPIAKWDFEENTGTTTFDKSGNAYNGTLTSTSSPLPSWILGKKGAALSFDGSTNYVTTATLGNFGSGLGSGATLEFWINTTTTATTKQIGVLNTVNTAYVVDFNRDKSLAASVGKTDFYIRDNDGKVVNAEISTNIYDGKWHHIAWSITNPSSNSFSVYVDGKAQTLSYGTQTAPTTFSNFQFPFMIGAVNNRGTPSSFINAKFDQVKIFNYGRSAAQVAWDYNRGAPVGHWKFDECQGTSTNDSSGNGNTGTITVGGLGTQTAVGTCTGSANTMWKDGASGKYNSSLDFDGTDDYVNVTSSTTLTISNDFTYSTWVKSTTTTPDYQNLFEYNNGSSIGVHAYLTGANNATANRGPLKVFVNFLDTSGNNHQYVTTNSNVWTSNQWYHITVLRNGSTIQIYIDGRLQDVSLDTTVGNTAISSSTVLQTTYDLQFGLRKSNSTLPLSGQIDDTKIYNYALTPVQVKGLYNGGATRFGPVTGSP